MKIEKAVLSDMPNAAKLDSHIPSERLEECISKGQIYILRVEAGDADERRVAGVLRYSLFWQSIPFLELLYIAEEDRNKGFGSAMMEKWEAEMKLAGYEYAMTSTQADETAWRFYEKIGYVRAGGFFPPNQQAEEIIYLKKL